MRVCLLSKIIPVEVEALVFVAVGNEIDRVARPHRENVLGRIVGNVDRLLAVEIVNPDVVGLAAAIALPGAEFPEDAVVGQLLRDPANRSRIRRAAAAAARSARRPPIPEADRL